MTTAFHDNTLSDLLPAYRRRQRRGTTPTDIHHFRTDVTQAMQAFQADVSYAVLMARAAVTIARKREIWQARRDARDQD